MTGAVAAVVGIGVLIVGPVTALTWAGKIPPDAATFVSSALMGVSFTFVGNLIFP